MKMTNWLFLRSIGKCLFPSLEKKENKSMLSIEKILITVRSVTVAKGLHYSSSNLNAIGYIGRNAWYALFFYVFV